MRTVIRTRRVHHSEKRVPLGIGLGHRAPAANVRIGDNTPTAEIEKSQIRPNVSIESNQRCGLKELIDFDSSELVDAVRIWSGWG